MWQGRLSDAALAGEMAFMQQLAHTGKIAQGIFIARRQG
jgi:hypothetical protein